MEMEMLHLLCYLMLLNVALSANYTDLFQPFWAPDHILSEGDLVKLTLDNISGCGIGSRRKYLFGQASVQIKLIEGDSAGTVTAFYKYCSPESAVRIQNQSTPITENGDLLLMLKLSLMILSVFHNFGFDLHYWIMEFKQHPSYIACNYNLDDEKDCPMVNKGEP